jgi:hypothetical protein
MKGFQKSCKGGHNISEFSLPIKILSIVPILVSGPRVSKQYDIPPPSEAKSTKLGARCCILPAAFSRLRKKAAAAHLGLIW